MPYTTFHIQKDRRINLGYCVHKFRDCPALKGRDVQVIEGPIVQAIPKCEKCYARVVEAVQPRTARSSTRPFPEVAKLLR